MISRTMILVRHSTNRTLVLSAASIGLDDPSKFVSHTMLQALAEQLLQSSAGVNGQIVRRKPGPRVKSAVLLGNGEFIACHNEELKALHRFFARNLSHEPRTPRRSRYHAPSLNPKSIFLCCFFRRNEAPQVYLVDKRAPLVNSAHFARGSWFA